MPSTLVQDPALDLFNRPARRVMVGLSGGVDSAVALYLLLQQGYAVEALFMKNWEEDDTTDYCSAAEDLASARAVAEHFDVNLHTVNFSAEYWDEVFEHFLAELRALRTPNPDILCNKKIKFAAFLDHARRLGADLIATGHYARIARDPSGYRLCRCADEDKDQTYFLHLLDQAQLSQAIFPLHDVTKGQVRTIARSLGLGNAERKDSTGICFIGERPFGEFLARYLPHAPGPIESPDGRCLGEHRGLAYYTIGQRQGLGIGGLAGAADSPWYVAAKNAARNTLIVVQQHDHPLLLSHGLNARAPHWISGQPPSLPLRCLARLRHRQPLQACEILHCDDDLCRVRFGVPQRAVNPGQSIVFYLGDECLGGAVIDDGWNSEDKHAQPIETALPPNLTHLPS